MKKKKIVILIAALACILAVLLAVSPELYRDAEKRTGDESGNAD